MNALTRLLADLVAIPSVNPMGRSGLDASGEKELAGFLVATLKQASIDTEVYDVLPGRPNVEGFIDAHAPETLLLEAHMDTVHGNGMTVEPFKPLIRDGNLYGRGACDTKGSIAAFLGAAMECLKNGRKLKYNVRLLFVSDEEYRFSGAQEAVRRGLKATFGIAGEPTNLAIVRAHKGVTRWKVIARGVSAHSAYPERGTNAIYVMADVIKRLQAHASELSQRTPDALLGGPSLSVGVIEGGQAVNMVPDSCWIEVDRRSLPGETTESILDPVRKALHGLDRVEINSPHIAVGGMNVAEGSPIVQYLGDAVKQTTGGIHITSAPYATDAGIYNSAGIPTVVFGPGDIAHAHTDAEFISLQQLEHASAIVQRLITN